MLNEEEMKKNCGFHKLLIKFKDIMSSKFLTEEKKCEELLDLYNFDKETFIELIDFFDFSNKDL